MVVSAAILRSVSVWKMEYKELAVLEKMVTASMAKLENSDTAIHGLDRVRIFIAAPLPGRRLFLMNCAIGN